MKSGPGINLLYNFACISTVAVHNKANGDRIRLGPGKFPRPAVKLPADSVPIKGVLVKDLELIGYRVDVLPACQQELGDVVVAGRAASDCWREAQNVRAYSGRAIAWPVRVDRRHASHSSTAARPSLPVTGGEVCPAMLSMNAWV